MQGERTVSNTANVTAQGRTKLKEQNLARISWPDRPEPKGYEEHLKVQSISSAGSSLGE